LIDNDVITTWEIKMTNAVTQTPAASADEAIQRFESELRFETDCWDTHDAMQQAEPGFVLLDVRSHEMFAKGHVSGAISWPHGKIVKSRMNAYPLSTLFVTYCAGPHCNGAVRGAAKLARLGFPVKIMAGGITGWLDEGFVLEYSEPASVAQ
jgi:rhodanese-related sulfurtransferase